MEASGPPELQSSLLPRFPLFLRSFRAKALPIGDTSRLAQVGREGEKREEMKREEKKNEKSWFVWACPACVRAV